MSKQNVSQQAQNRQKLIEDYPKDEQIDVLLQTQDMALHHLMKLNTAIDNVFRNLALNRVKRK